MRQTPLHEEHKALNAKIVDFHGWAMPLQYAGIVDEHKHTRAKAAVFDCSHMGEFILKGAEAVAGYDALVISDVGKIRTGRSRYGAILNPNGGIIDDAITFRMSEEELYVVTNAGTLEQIGALLTALPGDVRDVSAETAKIDVQGPQARETLLAIGMDAAADMRYFSQRRIQWQGEEILLSRTGYTGELGFEIYVSNERAVPLWRALLDLAPTAPAGLGARDTLRMEAGYPLSGQDFDENRTPLEANMEMFVGWDSEFPGKDRLLKQKEAGGYSMLTPIRTPDRRAPRRGFEVYGANGEAIGEVTSGSFGPSVGHGAGFAYLPQDCRAPGTQLTAGPRRLPIEAAEAPLYKQGTVRN